MIDQHTQKAVRLAFEEFHANLLCIRHYPDHVRTFARDKKGDYARKDIQMAYAKYASTVVHFMHYVTKSEGK